MTNEEAYEILTHGLLDAPSEHEWCIAFQTAIKALKQTDKVDESNFSIEQYEEDLRGAYDCGYNCGYADAMNDISESEVEE